MLQRYLVAVFLLIFVSGGGPVHGDAFEAEIEAFEYTAGGESICGEQWNIDAQAAADAAWLDPAGLGAGAAGLAKTALEVAAAAVSRLKPLQMHHLATNKNQKFSGRMAEIANN